MTGSPRSPRRSVQVLGRYTLNRLTIALTRLGLTFPGFWSPLSGLVVETVGRKTGKRRLTPVGYVREGPRTILVVAEHGRRADWVRNAAAGDVKIWIGRLRYPVQVRVREEMDPEEVLRRMKPLQAMGVRALAFEPKVIELEIRPNPTNPNGVSGFGPPCSLGG